MIDPRLGLDRMSLLDLLLPELLLLLSLEDALLIVLLAPILVLLDPHLLLLLSLYRSLLPIVLLALVLLLLLNPLVLLLSLDDLLLTVLSGLLLLNDVLVRLPTAVVSLGLLRLCLVLTLVLIIVVTMPILPPRHRRRAPPSTPRPRTPLSPCF